ncbi:hypothetical protein BT96DRAFT_935829 [Gymnopus androsaceus JB14]|uniref:Uncharacterized protein n=1 Tax=Gymnopus androsaceus JB14 TaxID=1447944 RepID=A0A6A4I1M5_9AGAR|nr:hypothetical protein BT96DRAFT_935829 [Gymnopus androsaceus JB14]
MFYKVILVAFAFITAASAAASPEGCVVIPVVSDECTNFTGGLSFLNDEVSFVNVPPGFVCTFYEDSGCLSAGPNAHDVAVLTGGTWNMANAPGLSGPQNFNDLTSSFTCSPV